MSHSKDRPDLRERRRRETRLDINEAALDLFERHGVAATTVDDIAKAAGVSASTFFRHFPTKEESILAVDNDLDDAFDEWIEASDPSEINLDGIEAVYERAALSTIDSSENLTSRILRTRRLIVGDAHLRATAIALDATSQCRMADAVAAKLDGRESGAYARLLVEGAGMTLRVAFDEWATRRDAGEDVELIDIYRATRQDLRRCVKSDAAV